MSAVKGNKVKFENKTSARSFEGFTELPTRKAISLMPSAKAGVSAKGADLGVLLQRAQLHVTELQAVLKQIIAVHPSGGGDAANYAALSAVLGALGKRLAKPCCRLKGGISAD